MRDDLLQEIASYTFSALTFSKEAKKTAKLALLDALGCALLALKFKDCTKLLGPCVEGTIVPKGSRVIGTSYVLDPVRAAFNMGTLIRWLDYNDTWLAKEWGHPSDNLGGILPLMDFLCQRNSQATVDDLLIAMIQAYEIQGGLSLNNSLNEIGFDHVLFVKVATSAVATRLLGGSVSQIADTVSNAFIDTGPLRTYRHAPSTGTRKSWAAGDATARGVELSFRTMKGEMGYAQALSSPKWGFYDTLFSGKSFSWQRPLSSYVMENLLFKVSYPAEFHAQTAVEAAVLLHPKVKDKWHLIKEIPVLTHASAIRIIDKKGPLHNPADRDHCLQYMVAVALLFGDLKAEDYEEKRAKDPRIDSLREKMVVKEWEPYSTDYLDPEKRSIASRLKIVFENGEETPSQEVEFPLGHKRRRQESIPLLFDKFSANAKGVLSMEQIEKIKALFQEETALLALPISDFVALLL